MRTITAYSLLALLLASLASGGDYSSVDTQQTFSSSLSLTNWAKEVPPPMNTWSFGLKPRAENQADVPPPKSALTFLFIALLIIAAMTAFLNSWLLDEQTRPLRERFEQWWITVEYLDRRQLCAQGRRRHFGFSGFVLRAATLFKKSTLAVHLHQHRIPHRLVSPNRHI